MKNTILACCLCIMGLTSCTKQVIEVIDLNSINAPVVNQYVKYTILQGQQYCTLNPYTPVKYEELKFVVKFDSSAVYKTVSTSNQVDINKLFGFSDNDANHQQFSARFGWRWSNNALRLFAYVYNNGVMSFKELGTVAIGTENNCSIKVTSTSYIFTLNDKTDVMPRNSTSASASGYKLYPYFGGDETAPHEVSIWIKEIGK
jgi:hypothetical protein